MLGLVMVPWARFRVARWPDDDRRSRLVFITCDLDRAAVAASWNEMS